MPRVGRDAQIDGGIAYWTASEIAIIYPFGCVAIFFVCELIISLVIKCSGLCNSGILDVVGDG